MSSYLLWKRNICSMQLCVITCCITVHVCVCFVWVCVRGWLICKLKTLALWLRSPVQYQAHTTAATVTGGPVGPVPLLTELLLFWHFSERHWDLFWGTLPYSVKPSSILLKGLLNIPVEWGKDDNISKHSTDDTFESPNWMLSRLVLS